MASPSNARGFQFGRNWVAYSSEALTVERINQARADFSALLRDVPVKGNTFLDIGFGQGLSLCLAAEMGAVPTGVDIDSDNEIALSSTIKLFSELERPKTIVGSILDDQVLKNLEGRGGFDIVHSWGVLHHTGNLGLALSNACRLVKPGGHLVIAIYNHHFSSPIWKLVKWTYCQLPEVGRALLIGLLYPPLFLATWLLTGKHPYASRRGMSFYHDVVDWVGGYPYEYAAAAKVQKLVEDKGFRLLRQEKAKVPTGNNEFIFQRNA